MGLQPVAALQRGAGTQVSLRDPPRLTLALHGPVYGHEHGVLDVATREVEVLSQGVQVDVRCQGRLRWQVPAPDLLPQFGGRHLELEPVEDAAVERLIQHLPAVGGQDSDAVKLLELPQDRGHDAVPTAVVKHLVRLVKEDNGMLEPGLVEDALQVLVERVAPVVSDLPVVHQHQPVRRRLGQGVRQHGLAGPRRTREEQDRALAIAQDVIEAPFLPTDQVVVPVHEEVQDLLAPSGRQDHLIQIDVWIDHRGEADHLVVDVVLAQDQAADPARQLQVHAHELALAVDLTAVGQVQESMAEQFAGVDEVPTRLDLLLDPSAEDIENGPHLDPVAMRERLHDAAEVAVQVRPQNDDQHQLLKLAQTVVTGEDLQGQLGGFRRQCDLRAPVQGVLLVTDLGVEPAQQVLQAGAIAGSAAQQLLALRLLVPGRPHAAALGLDLPTGDPLPRQGLQIIQRGDEVLQVADKRLGLRDSGHGRACSSLLGWTLRFIDLLPLYTS